MTANAYARLAVDACLSVRLSVYDASESQSTALGFIEIGLSALYGFSVMHQSHGLFAIANLYVIADTLRYAVT